MWRPTIAVKQCRAGARHRRYWTFVDANTLALEITTTVLAIVSILCVVLLVHVVVAR